MVIEKNAGRKPHLSSTSSTQARKPQRVKPAATVNTPAEVTIRTLKGGKESDASRQLRFAQAWLDDLLEKTTLNLSEDQSTMNSRMIAAAHELRVESRRSISRGEPDRRPVTVWAKPTTKQLIDGVEETITRIFHQLDKLDLQDACPRHLAMICEVTGKLSSIMSDFDDLTYELAEALQGSESDRRAGK